VPPADHGAADGGPTTQAGATTAVQITRFGGPEVLDVVGLPDPVPGPEQQFYAVATAGINYADTHQSTS
jgi:NADPH:quinone reductase-like Zn-dependent oxidoreductase